MPRRPRPIPTAALAAAATLACAAVPAAEIRKPDLTGLWTTYTGGSQGRASGFGGSADDLPLTEEGRRRVDEYERLSGPEQLNAAAHCATYGTPTMMLLPGSYPIEFIQKPDQLTIIFEVNNETRRIYIGDEQLPPGRRIPSRAGYSEGHWQGDELVVETTVLLDGLDHPSYPHSEQATIAERFFLDQDDEGTLVLTYQATITDPVYYTEPVELERKYEPHDGFILPYQCQDELWYELLEMRRDELEAGEPIDARMSDVYEAREAKE